MDFNTVKNGHCWESGNIMITITPTHKQSFIIIFNLYETERNNFNILISVFFPSLQNEVAYLDPKFSSLLQYLFTFPVTYTN